MALRILSPAKALRTLRKMPILMDALLYGVTDQIATTVRDGPGGWSALFIVCHIWDYERILRERVELILDQDNPTLPVVSNETLMAQHEYARQSFSVVVREYHQRRAALISRLEDVTDEQWQRTGVHPEQGVGTLLDIAINAGLHDVDHIEQLARTVALLRVA